MITKILDWILGKNKSGDSHPLDGATRAAQEKVAPYKVEAPVAAPVETTVAVVEPTPPVVETTPVTVKAKYKKADLNKKTKKELLELVAQHGLEVKARATKDEIVKALSKV
jgi:hypothetical protein